MNIKLNQTTCPVCDDVLFDHSNSQLKKCELIMRISVKEQDKQTQAKIQGLLSFGEIIIKSLAKKEGLDNS